jgi:hypothetical protein
MKPPFSMQLAFHRRHHIPGLNEFAMSLQTYISKVGSVSPIYGRSKEENPPEEKETTTDCAMCSATTKIWEPSDHFGK